jgi:hypothetical protein
MLQNLFLASRTKILEPRIRGRKELTKRFVLPTISTLYYQRKQKPVETRINE